MEIAYNLLCLGDKIRHKFSLVKMNFPPKEMSHLEIPLEENVNRITPDEGTVEARTIEDAIAVLRYYSYMICVTSCQYGCFDVD